MIKRVSFSGLDRQFIALKSIETNPIRADFSKIIVNKPWGYEYLLTSTPLVEVWHLSLDYLKSTSVHCHPNKKTALIVLDGKAQFSSLNESIELSPLDAVVMDSGVFHSTQSLSKKGLKLLEIETPPMKHDLIRMKDNYGRAGKGYEGIKEMQLAKNNTYINFDDKTHARKKFCGKEVCFSFVEDKKDFSKKTFLKKSELSVILSGFIRSNNKLLYKLGDVVSTKELRRPEIKFKNVSLLSISKQ